MRYKIIFSYDGSYFHGFQRQKNALSVQQTIEVALNKILNEPIEIKGAGRTDSGVHAMGQVAHFDTAQVMPVAGFQEILNKYLMPHIYIKSLESVDSSFHARINVVSKEYRYYISLNEFNPCLANYIYFYPSYYLSLNIDQMKVATKEFLGTHDFRSFTKNQKLMNTIRTIFECSLTVKDNILEFIFIGDGFMYNMVRIIVMLLLKIGTGEKRIEDIKTIFDKLDRRSLPYLAPAEGLYLWKVNY